MSVEEYTHVCTREDIWGTLAQQTKEEEAIPVTELRQVGWWCPGGGFLAEQCNHDPEPVYVVVEEE